LAPGILQFAMVLYKGSDTKCYVAVDNREGQVAVQFFQRQAAGS